MADKHIIVTPAKVFLIPDLALRDNLPPEGRTVEDSAYWQRRAAEGSVTITEPPPPPVEKAAKGK